MLKKIISFQGLPGAYSDLVCRKFFKDYETLPCPSFEEAISSVENEKAKYAMIPVENNIAGRVTKAIHDRNTNGLFSLSITIIKMY